MRTDCILLSYLTIATSTKTANMKKHDPSKFYVITRKQIVVKRMPAKDLPDQDSPI